MSVTKRRDFLKTAGMGLMAAGAVLAETPSRRVRIGQIGTGHAHASGKMATLRKLADHFEVVGIVEQDAERRRAAEKQSAYQGLRWMTEGELLGAPGLQAVAVETEVSGLLSAAARCVSAGMHIHLDKPAGDSMPEFKALLEDATRRHVTVQMGYMYRHNPAFRFCLEALRKGWQGEVFEVDAVMSKVVGVSDRERLSRFPGGSMFELGCHLIDTVVALLGPPEKVTPYLRRTRPEQDSLADNTLAILEYPKATATIRSALLEVEGQRRRQIVICGDQGTIEWRPLEPPRLTLTLDGDRAEYKKGSQEVVLPEMPGRYDEQLLAFARVVRGEAKPEYGPDHDLAVQEAILRASGMPLR